MAPAAVATALFRPHLLTFNAFTLLGLAITLFEHSGYDFVNSGHFHDLHHRLAKARNLGLLGTFDHLHRTRAYPKKRRDGVDADPGATDDDVAVDADPGGAPDAFLVSRAEQ